MRYPTSSKPSNVWLNTPLQPGNSNGHEGLLPWEVGAFERLPKERPRNGFALPLALALLTLLGGLLLWTGVVLRDSLSMGRADAELETARQELRVSLQRRSGELAMSLSRATGGVGLLNGQWVLSEGTDPAVILGSATELEDLSCSGSGGWILPSVAPAVSGNPAAMAQDWAYLQQARGALSGPPETFVPLASGLFVNRAAGTEAPSWRAGDATGPLSEALACENLLLQDGKGLFDPARLELRFGPTADGRYPLRPVLTEAALHWGVFAGTPGSGERHDLRLRFFIEVEIWNPYAFPLRFPAQPQSRALRLWVSGLPWVRVRNLTRGLEVGPFDPDAARNEHSGVRGIQGWLEIEAGGDRSGQALVLQPGEVYRILAPWSGQQAEGQARTLGDRVLPLAGGDAIEVELQPKAAGLSVRLLPYRDGDEGADLDSVPVLQSWEGIPVAAATLSYPRADVQPRPFLLRLSTDCRLDMMRLDHHLRIHPQRTDLWVLRGGARAQTLDHAAWAECFDTVSADPAQAATLRAACFGSEPLMDVAHRSHRAWDRTDLRLWDYPCRPPLPLMGLRSWGGITAFDWSGLGAPAHPGNTYFDSHTSALGDGAPLRSCLTTVPANDPVSSGAQIRATVFNINSQSWSAWRQFLNSAAGPLRTGDATASPREIGRGELFYRHRYAQLWLSGWSERGSLLDGGTEGIAARQGLHRLDAATLDQLAACIVERLRQRSRPFSSLREFLDSGLLDAALEAVGPARPHPESGLEIPAVRPINEGLWLDGRRQDHLPGCLTQSDVWERLAPWAVVQGDTWRLRLEGAGAAPDGSPRRRLRCEAVLQCLPESVTRSVTGGTSSPGISRLRWSLVHFSWR